MVRHNNNHDLQHLTIPPLFRCPISMDVMKSPVSLCTGVTYDRSSIQAWLDTGHNTCPATMQILPSTDFVPNLTLRRLIHKWSHPSPDLLAADRLLYSLSNSSDRRSLLPLLSEIADFASSAVENREFLANHDGFLGSVVTTLANADRIEEMEMVFSILSLLVSESRVRLQLCKLVSDQVLSKFVSVLRRGGLPSRITSATVLESVLLDSESRRRAGEYPCLLEEVFALAACSEQHPCCSEQAAGLSCKTRLSCSEQQAGLFCSEQKAGLSCKTGLSCTEQQAGLSCKTGLSCCCSEQKTATVQAGLSCLAAISVSSRRTQKDIVRMGVARVCREILATAAGEGKGGTLALLLLERVSACAEGRAAIGSDAALMAQVVKRIMKGPRAATESGVAVVWSACYLSRDVAAQEAAAAANGLTKALLVMQSDCSVGAKKMCAELVKVFRVNSRSCLASYDTQTTHIMPY